MSPIVKAMTLVGFLSAANVRAQSQDTLREWNDMRKTDIRLRFECNQVAHARVDPVVNPGTCATHVHSFFGNAHIANRIEYSELAENIVTSCTAQQGSLYWVPSLYYRDDNGRYQVAFGSVVIYYEFPENNGETLYPIPVGHRQLVGDPNRQVEYPSPPDSGDFWPFFTCYTEDGDEIVATSIEKFAADGRSCTTIEATVIYRDCLETVDAVDSDDHKAHVRYAPIGGTCPDTHKFRIPRIRMEVSYELSAQYDLSRLKLSTGGDSWTMHADYIAGWTDEKKLMDAMNTCRLTESNDINSGCSIRSEVIQEQPSTTEYDPSLLPNEPVTDVIELPSGACDGYGTVTTVGPTTTTSTSTTTTTTTTIATTTTSTTTPTTTTTTTTTTTDGDDEPEMRWVACGSGYNCNEGFLNEAFVFDPHEVRCCKDCSVEVDCSSGWMQKCDFFPNIFAISRIEGDCFSNKNFYDAVTYCSSVGGRLCTQDEVIEGCTKGTGCGHDRDMVWVCMYQGGECEFNSECCSGRCGFDGICM